MPPQDRRWTGGGDRSIEGGPDGRALGGPGHDRRRPRHSHYEGNGERERGAGDVLEAGRPPPRAPPAPARARGAPPPRRAASPTAAGPAARGRPRAGPRP